MGCLVPAKRDAPPATAVGQPRPSAPQAGQPRFMSLAGAFLLRCGEPAEALASSTLGSASSSENTDHSAPGARRLSYERHLQMFHHAKPVLFACLLLSVSFVPSGAAEREDVRKVINLVASVKMPYPESLPRNRAKTLGVTLDRGGATTGCIRLEERRWCYEHIAPDGN